jgi:cyclohexyl-isocyanide hydratase
LAIEKAKDAQYVTSVCPGAFILGAADLLQGKRATTHWAYVDLLPLVGALYEKGRIVRDGNVVTAGGVIEYDPHPPFDSGSPDQVPPDLKAAVLARNEAARSSLQATITELRAS